MESPILNLQERLQKLIDQYTADKKAMDELKIQYARLREENVQLMSQIEDYSKLLSDTEGNLKNLQIEHDKLQGAHNDMQNMLFGIESFADDAIKKIDGIFPKLEDSE
jgi:predicted  nucleic acid-binding Zn-ribbon protein